MGRTWISSTGHAAARKAIAALAGCVLVAACAGSPNRASTGEVIDDTVITSKVKAAMLADDAGTATAVSVETFKGTVLLAGFVNSVVEREQAERVARAVHGVKEVRNRIEVR